MTAVCVVGSLVVDHLVRVRRRPGGGETAVAHGYQRRLGGKGFNQAVAAARSGAVTALVGAIGDDEAGREFLAFLDGEEIDRHGVQRSSTALTGFAFPVTDELDGENAIVVVPMANELVEPVTMASMEPLRIARVVTLQLELPLPIAREAATVARHHGGQVVLNMAPVVTCHDPLAGLVDHLVLNRHELSAAAGPGDPAAAGARLLHEWRCSSVIVTLGAHGVLVITGEEETEVSPFPVRARDAVGAGDTFCGALAARLALGVDVLDAVQYANIAAALAVAAGEGAAGMPRHEDVMSAQQSVAHA